MARHNQFRARNQHLNLTDLWDQACMGLRGTGGDAELINETITGFNPALGSTPSEINNTGRIINWYSTPFTLEIVSVTGTDAQPLQVSYINGNGDLIESIVTLTGTTPVAIPDVQLFLLAPVPADIFPWLCISFSVRWCITHQPFAVRYRPFVLLASHRQRIRQLLLLTHACNSKVN